MKALPAVAVVGACLVPAAVAGWFLYDTCRDFALGTANMLDIISRSIN